MPAYVLWAMGVIGSWIVLKFLDWIYSWYTCYNHWHTGSSWMWFPFWPGIGSSTNRWIHCWK